MRKYGSNFSDGARVGLCAISNSFHIYIFDPTIKNQGDMVPDYFCVRGLQIILFCFTWFTNGPHITGMMKNLDPLELTASSITAIGKQQKQKRKSCYLPWLNKYLRLVYDMKNCWTCKYIKLYFLNAAQLPEKTKVKL